MLGGTLMDALQCEASKSYAQVRIYVVESMSECQTLIVSNLDFTTFLIVMTTTAVVVVAVVMMMMVAVVVMKR